MNDLCLGARQRSERVWVGRGWSAWVRGTATALNDENASDRCTTERQRLLPEGYLVSLSPQLAHFELNCALHMKYRSCSIVT